MDEIAFPAAFEALTGNAPFPWQEALYARFAAGEIPPSCNLPTGLGKTSVIPIWMIALANRAQAVPRRLAYVVNRRTVVDQATNEAETFRKRLLDPGHEATGLDSLPRQAGLRSAGHQYVAGSVCGQWRVAGRPGSPGDCGWDCGYGWQPAVIQRLRRRVQRQATSRRVPRAGCAARAR